MKYPEIVAKAKETAKLTNMRQIVYECRAKVYPFKKGFGYCRQVDFNLYVESGEYPLIRLLLILPNGIIVQ